MGKVLIQASAADWRQQDWLQQPVYLAPRAVVPVRRNAEGVTPDRAVKARVK
jgi:hypothetical protein